MSSTTSPQAETHAFQAEVRQLLDLMIHSLYSHKEIFLRELISNASDALDKLRVAALTDGELLAGEQRLAIRLEPDTAARTLTVVDNGIGMTREEVIENVGTIARSGTRRFLEELRAQGERGQKAPELIGQFGVGFYSCFMVAEEVVLETRKAGTDAGVRWLSKGDGSFTVEDAGDLPRGTRITLHLKALDEDEAGAKDFTEEWVLRDIVRRYSDFIEYPVEMDVERLETPEGEPEAEPKRVRRTETLNSQKPLWTRPRGEIKPEEYADFYRHMARDWDGPLDTIHFKAEGTLEYTALLFLPKHRPPGLFDPSEAKSRVSLYVKRVFIAADLEELMPGWLRFVRGLVDSSDLPLNVSRETLQHTRQVGQIRRRLTRKVLEALASLLAERRADYEGFWRAFGPVLKEGLYGDDELRQELAGLCLLHTSAGETLATLDEVVARMPVDQPAIYTLSAPDLAAARRSPHLEAFAKRGHEVLLLVDPVDEFAFQRLEEYSGKPLRSISKGEIDTDDASKARREEQSKKHGDLLAAVLRELDEEVGEVRFSSRLVDSPAVLVSGEHQMAPHVERMLRESGQAAMGLPIAKRTLELNPEHPLVARLEALRGADETRFGDFCDLLYGQALLAEGSPLPDPGRFAGLVTRLMVAAPEPAGDGA